VIADEYAIDPRRFAKVLREQRSSRMKGGIYHLTQIVMAYNSNKIEGSQLSSEQTRYIYETRTIAGDDVNVDDIIETVNHFQAFDEMLDQVDEPITAQTMKSCHRTLKHGTADARQDWFAIGDWKRLANAIGDVQTTAPAKVELEITQLLRSVPETMSFEDIVDFHHRFERIHPFQDGNGRVGRLLMFQQCLRNGIMPFVVLDAQKQFYYRGLSEYDDEPGFLRDTFRSFQDAYYDRFAPFVEVLPASGKYT